MCTLREESRGRQTPCWPSRTAADACHLATASPRKPVVSQADAAAAERLLADAMAAERSLDASLELEWTLNDTVAQRVLHGWGGQSPGAKGSLSLARLGRLQALAERLTEECDLPLRSQPRSPLQQAVPPCCERAEMYGQPAALSAENDWASSEIDEARGLARALEAKARAEEEVDRQRRAQADLADQLQLAEQELARLEWESELADADWRQGATDWEQKYLSAKARGPAVDCLPPSREEAAHPSEVQLEELRQELAEARWDLEDARADCAATDSRVVREEEAAQHERTEAMLGLEQALGAAEQAQAASRSFRARMEASRANLAAQHEALRRNGEQCGELEDAMRELALREQASLPRV